MKMKADEILEEFSSMMGRVQNAMRFIFAEPLEDEEIEKLRLQYAEAFYKMLGEYARGKMSKMMIIKHIKEYLDSLEKRMGDNL